LRWYVCHVTRKQFQAAFVAGPLLFSSILPTLLFGALIGEWGSNILWGSVFGLGWCLAAFASGNIVHDSFSTTVGLLWGWLVLVPLYFASGWLWTKLDRKGRTIAIAFLLVSFLFAVPSETMMGWDQRGMHLPDYSLHLAYSY
jgi:hypothetical protein